MKLFAALVVLFLAGRAHSFEYILPCTGTGPALTTPTPVKPPGLPAQVAPVAGEKAICGSYVVGYAPTGIAFGYWCQAAPDRHPYPVLGAVRRESITPEMVADWAAIAFAPDRPEAIRLFQAKHQTTHFYNMCDVWGHPSTDWRMRFNAAMPVAVVPPVATWKTVAPIAFNVSGTTLSGVAGSVAIGTACDCAKPAKIGTATYCTFTGAARPTVMASCKVTP